MYQGLVHLHNLLRWVVLILAVIAVIKAYSGMVSLKPFTSGDKKIGLFLMISAHTILLLGLYQWLFGPWGLHNILNSGFAAVMKNRVMRYWAVEHFLGMIIVVALITIGRSAGKKSYADKIKFKRTFWFFLIALLIILVNSPWPARVGIGRPLVPGMHQPASTP